MTAKRNIVSFCFSILAAGCWIFIFAASFAGFHYAYMERLAYLISCAWCVSASVSWFQATRVSTGGANSCSQSK